jgi:hypothetical protein
MAKTKPVITYQLAYLSGSVSLCEDCTPAYDECVSLGPVLHGTHDGTCEACALEAEEKARKKV